MIHRQKERGENLPLSLAGGPAEVQEGGLQQVEARPSSHPDSLALVSHEHLCISVSSLITGQDDCIIMTPMLAFKN